MLTQASYHRPSVHRALLDKACAAYEGDDPYWIAVYLAGLHGIRTIPVHGIRKAPAETGVECECMKGRRKRAETGNLPLVPCPQPGKLPHTRDWPNVASIDPVEINKWHLRWPLANYSAVTGPGSNVWVLDIDGDLGFASLANILADIDPLPPTWMTQSGSGNGAHYWFRRSLGTDIRNSASQIGPGIDVRGYNGHVLLPGSLHKSGNRYRFMKGHAPHEVDLAEAPEALVHLALDACKKTRRDCVEPQRAQTFQASRHPRPASRNHSKSLLIGDGEGYGGFHVPINKIAVKHFGLYGADADIAGLKASLRHAIITAPNGNHRPDDICRYASDAYLDEAIESARRYITEGGKQMD